MQHLLGDDSEDEIAGGGVVGAERELLGAARLDVVDALRRVIGVDQHQIGIVRIGRHAAEPCELGRIELRLRIALNRELRRSALELGEHGAVALGRIVDAVGGDEAAAARSILHADERIARDEAAEMLGREARRDVVDAAGRGADQHSDGLAAVELLDGLCVCGWHRDQSYGQAAQHSCQ